MAHWPRSQTFLAEANRLMSLSARDLEGDQAWLVEHAGAPIGYYRLTFEGVAAEIEELFVEPAWIGRGIGRRLFEHAVATARDNGCVRLEWDSDNEARGFYLAMGAHVTGTRPSGMQGQAPLNRMRINVNV